jgi:hypothetical protein
VEIRTALPSLVALINDKHHDVQLATVSVLTKLADYGEFVPILRSINYSCKCEAELYEAIKNSIPSLIQLLGVQESYGRLTIVSLLSKLAARGEFATVCSLDITNADIKSSFARQLRRLSRRSLHCSMEVTTTFDWLSFLH